MTLKTITFDDEQWQVVPKKLTLKMRHALVAGDQGLSEDWENVLAVAPTPPVLEIPDDQRHEAVSKILKDDES